MSRAVILTALPVEYLAVRTHLSNLQEEMHPQGTIYERGTFAASEKIWEVGIAEVGMGNAETAVEAERAIAYFKPDFLFFVGIAGGIKDVAIGDVVAATKIYSYESGKVGEHFFSRPTLGQSAHALVQRARAEARKGEWVRRLSSSPAFQPRVFVAPIAAGEKIVASKKSDTFNFIRTSYNDVIAIEMEGFGFLKAAFAYPNIKAIVIRGISDLIEHKNSDMPESGQVPEQVRQEKASLHAGAFAFELLAKLHIQSSQQLLVPEPSIKSNISASLDPTTLQHFVVILRPLLRNESDRRPFFMQALGSDIPVLNQIEWGGAVDTFTVYAVDKLSHYGKLPSGQTALSALLKYARTLVGVDVQQRIDTLQARLNS
ncbi:MAG: hypothetical protein AAGD25_22190 [Cyanobacteria bacterium P01_F01_bin.150]